MKIGHVFVYFCVISGHKNQQKQNKPWVFEETRFVQLLVGWWCLLKPSCMQRSCYAKEGCFEMVSHKRQQHAATQHAFPELQPFMHRISAEFARSFWHEQTSSLISNRSFRVPVTSSEHLRTLKAAPVQVGTCKSRIFDVVQSPHCWRESERTISNLMFW